MTKINPLKHKFEHIVSHITGVGRSSSLFVSGEISQAG
jgi:hypothetical protein